MCSSECQRLVSNILLQHSPGCLPRLGLSLDPKLADLSSRKKTACSGVPSLYFLSSEVTGWLPCPRDFCVHARHLNSSPQIYSANALSTGPSHQLSSAHFNSTEITSALAFEQMPVWEISEHLPNLPYIL